MTKRWLLLVLALMGIEAVVLDVLLTPPPLALNDGVRCEINSGWVRSCTCPGEVK